MKSQIKIFLPLFFLSIIGISTQYYAQDKIKPDSAKHCMKKADCCKHKSVSAASRKCKKGTETATVSNNKLAEADKNQDGKVYQCPMCADQAADESGKCTKCGMDLREVSLGDAKKITGKKKSGMMGHMGVDKMDHSERMKHGMGHGDADKTDSKSDKIVREGEINLKAIDKNGDNKVFQDQMDWNVISDNPGSCPICNMTLSEVTVERAKKNLKDAGLKVKEN